MPDGMNGLQCHFEGDFIGYLDGCIVKDERSLIERQICDVLSFLPCGITKEQVSHLWKIGRYESTLYLERLVEDGYLVKDTLLENTSVYYGWSDMRKYPHNKETQ